MGSEANSGSNNGVNNIPLNLPPVAPEQSGEGLPYAPENVPNPGDIWRWKTGKRISINGNFRDRYLHPPARLSAPSKRRGGFPSKRAVERYLKENLPHVDVDGFFASFSWHIPSGNSNPIVDGFLQQLELEEESESDVLCGNDGCKALNKKCSSLILEEEKEHLPVMPCDICCAEPNFCRECCCIYCYKPVDSAYGGYSYIMCKVKHGDNICGHLAHLECALRIHLAGTVGGMIGLDAEYYCRRCDGRTELISHANKILLTCETIDSGDNIKETILNLGICLLDGSEKATAKELVSRILLALSKLKHETKPENSFNAEDNLTANSADSFNNGNVAMDTAEDESPLNHSNVRKRKKSFCYLSESLKLEAEVDEVLADLKNAKNHEYKLAEESLKTHKKYLQDLNQQLAREECELRTQSNASHSDELFQTIQKRKEQLRQGLVKFEEMKKVANGFGNTSKDVLEKHFGL